jgi:hypothetical protein
MEELNKKEIKIISEEIMNDTIKHIFYWGLCCLPSVHGFFIIYNDSKCGVVYYTKEDIKLIKRKNFLNGMDK